MSFCNSDNLEFRQTSVLSAPRIFINDKEENSTTLIDNDDTTCVQLPGYDGCKMDRVIAIEVFPIRC